MLRMGKNKKYLIKFVVLVEIRQCQDLENTFVNKEIIGSLLRLEIQCVTIMPQKIVNLLE